VRLVQSSGGAFEVTMNEDLIFSKKTLGRHAQPGEIMGLIQGRSA
jgi:selT/selW/selH-like putative selenoprotein